jgi:hypothetical protein
VLLLLALAFVPATALAQEDVALSMLMESAGEEPSEMTVTVSGEMARMDYNDHVSMVWSPEWWRMFQHENKIYMEFDKAMMEQMARMMGSMPGAPDVEAEVDAFDPTSMTFERTGATDTVMGYKVFEVAFATTDGEQGSMWMSEEAEYGVFEIFTRMMSHLEQVAGPMMGGGNNPAGNMQQYMQMARAQGMPDGKVLRMDTVDGTHFTVTGWEMGPFGAETWEPPAGYQKQAMPSFPR